MKYPELPQGKPCRIIIERNIINVQTGKPLDYPLRYLNASCEFKKVWNKFVGIPEEVRAKQKEYNRRPEVRAKKREYNRRPEVRAKKREYHRLYYIKRKRLLK